MTQHQAPDWQTVDVAAFLRERVQEHREAADRAQVSVEVAPADHVARFDPRLIGRAVDNILLNAIRHTPAGGRVSIHTEQEAAVLRIILSDTGPGIAPELHSRLFEPFATGRPEGTGLGLAIAREMVAAHGGRIALGDTPAGSAGATFIMELPQG